MGSNLSDEIRELKSKLQDFKEALDGSTFNFSSNFSSPSSPNLGSTFTPLNSLSTLTKSPFNYEETIRKYKIDDSDDDLKKKFRTPDSKGSMHYSELLSSSDEDEVHLDTPDTPKNQIPKRKYRINSLTTPTQANLKSTPNANLKYLDDIISPTITRSREINNKQFSPSKSSLSNISMSPIRKRTVSSEESYERGFRPTPILKNKRTPQIAKHDTNLTLSDDSDDEILSPYFDRNTPRINIQKKVNIIHNKSPLVGLSDDSDDIPISPIIMRRK